MFLSASWISVHSYVIWIPIVLITGALLWHIASIFLIKKSIRRQVKYNLKYLSTMCHIQYLGKKKLKQNIDPFFIDLKRHVFYWKWIEGTTGMVYDQKRRHLNDISKNMLALQTVMLPLNQLIFRAFENSEEISRTFDFDNKLLKQWFELISFQIKFYQYDWIVKNIPLFIYIISVTFLEKKEILILISTLLKYSVVFKYPTRQNCYNSLSVLIETNSFTNSNYESKDLPEFLNSYLKRNNLNSYEILRNCENKLIFKKKIESFQYLLAKDSKCLDKCDKIRSLILREKLGNI